MGMPETAQKSDQLSQPDLFVLPYLPPDRADWSGFPNPALVIEVLSPSTARFDRVVKRRRFQRAAIPEYWVVDLDARAVERWRPAEERPEIIDDQLTWHPGDAAEPLGIDLPRYFTEVWGR